MRRALSHLIHWLLPRVALAAVLGLGLGATSCGLQRPSTPRLTQPDASLAQRAAGWLATLDTLLVELASASTCPEQCRLAARICEAAGKICEIAAERPDDPTLADRCVSARGHCDAAQARCQACTSRDGH